MFSLPRITKWILGINCGVWLFCMMMPLRGVIPGLTVWEENFALFPVEGTLPLFRPWQLITYSFLHADLGHLLCNMFAVYMFGPVLERRWGEGRYLIYYSVCAIGAGLVQLLVWHLMGVTVALTIGASGAVFGLLFAFGYFFPDVEMFLLFLPIPIRARTFVMGYAVLELLLGVGSIQGDNVAHFAHLGGLLFGGIVLLIWHLWDHHGRSSHGGNHAGYHYQPSV